MANSSDVAAGADATATQYNNLRKDVLDTSTGHRHSGATDGGMTLFGAWTGRSFNQGYTAATDLIVVATMFFTGTNDSLAGNTPTATQRVIMSNNANTQTHSFSITFPVRKGDTWKVITSGGTPVKVWEIGIGA